MKLLLRCIFLIFSLILFFQCSKDSTKLQIDEKYEATFDWRDSNIVTIPKNQGNLGSCAVFAALGVFESAIARETGEQVDLSEQHFINVSPHWNAATGVSPERVFEFMINNGIVLEEFLPYINGESNDVPGHSFDYKLDSFGSVRLEGNSLHGRIQLIKENIQEHGPVISNITLYNNFGDYQEGVYESLPASGVAGGHWLLFTGWVDDEDMDCGGYWICKNSWGTNWGEDGFCRVMYGDECGIDDYILYYVDYTHQYGGK